MKIQYMQHK